LRRTRFFHLQQARARNGIAFQRDSLRPPGPTGYSVITVLLGSTETTVCPSVKTSPSCRTSLAAGGRWFRGGKPPVARHAFTGSEKTMSFPSGEMSVGRDQSNHESSRSRASVGHGTSSPGAIPCCDERLAVGGDVQIAMLPDCRCTRRMRPSSVTAHRSCLARPRSP